MVREYDRLLQEYVWMNIVLLVEKYFEHLHFENSFHRYYELTYKHEILINPTFYFQFIFRNHTTNFSLRFVWWFLSYILRYYSMDLYWFLHTNLSFVKPTIETFFDYKNTNNRLIYLFNRRIRQISVNNQCKNLIFQMFFKEKFDEWFLRTNAMQKNIKTRSRQTHVQWILILISTQTLNIDSIHRTHFLEEYWPLNIHLLYRAMILFEFQVQFYEDHRELVEWDYFWIFSFSLNQSEEKSSSK